MALEETAGGGIWCKYRDAAACSNTEKYFHGKIRVTVSERAGKSIGFCGKYHLITGKFEAGALQRKMLSSVETKPDED